MFVIIIVLFFGGFGSVKKAVNGVKLDFDYSKSQSQVNKVLNEIKNNNLFPQESLTKSLGSKLTSAASERLNKQQAYNNAMKNDPPWYLEWKDGILWWDKKRTTLKEFNSAKTTYGNLLTEYKNQVATDSILNNAKNSVNSKSIDKGIVVIIVLVLLLLLFTLLSKLFDRADKGAGCSNNNIRTSSNDSSNLNANVSSSVNQTKDVNKYKRVIPITTQVERQNQNFELMDLSALNIESEE